MEGLGEDRSRVVRPGLRKYIMKMYIDSITFMRGFRGRFL
jgi:hypothetical protein